MGVKEIDQSHIHLSILFWTIRETLFLSKNMHTRYKDYSVFSILPTFRTFLWVGLSTNLYTCI